MEEPVCFICQEEIEEGQGVVPCECAASRHLHCMEAWIEQRRELHGQVPTTCEICEAPYRYDEIEIRHSKLRFYAYEAFYHVGMVIAPVFLGLLIAGSREALFVIRNPQIIALALLFSSGINSMFFSVRLRDERRDWGPDHDRNIFIFYLSSFPGSLILMGIGVFLRIYMFHVDSPRYWSFLSFLTGLLSVACTALGLFILYWIGRLCQKLADPEIWRAFKDSIIRCCMDVEQQRVLARERRPQDPEAYVPTRRHNPKK